jgi:hypothetical protein
MPDPLVANARMYAVTPAVTNAWRSFFAWLSERSGVALTYLENAAPAPLEELWSRDDLGAAFMCGFPFASAPQRPRLVAAPVPSSPRYETVVQAWLSSSKQPMACCERAYNLRLGLGTAISLDTKRSWAWRVTPFHRNDLVAPHQQRQILRPCFATQTIQCFWIHTRSSRPAGPCSILE